MSCTLYIILFRKDLGVIYQALYRKYRPRTFDDVWGQENITETLKKQVSTGRTSHAYLFVGTRGTGKTTCAKLLARAVNCEHPVNGSPCNECPSCRGIEAGTIMDVVEIDAASNNGVDNIRALRDEAIFSPATVKKRVYIVDEVHMLSSSAFNALLKILEEPPEHLMFILATTELRKVPATILSRCQRFNFRRLDADVIAKRLDYVAKNEGINLTEGAARLLARLADGGMRDALSLLDQCSGRDIIDESVVLETTGAAGSGRIVQMLEAVAAHDTASALSLFAELWRDGKDPAGVLGDLNGLMRDALMLAVAPKGGGALVSGAYDTDTLRRLGAMFTRAELLADMSAAQEGITQLRDSPSARTTAELTLVKLCTPALNPSALEARVASLEQTVSALRSGAAPSAPANASPLPETHFEPPAQAAGVPGRTAAPEPVKAPEPAAETKPAKTEPPAAKETFAPADAPDDMPPWSDEDAPPPPDDGDAPPWEAAPESRAPRAFTPPAQLAPEPSVPAQPDTPRVPGPEDAGAPEPRPSAAGGFDWDAYLRIVMPRVGVGYRHMLKEPSKAFGELDGGVLTLHLESGLLYNGMKAQNNMEILRSSASELLGREVNIRLLPIDGTVQRSLDELRAFQEVRFIRKDGN